MLLLFKCILKHTSLLDAIGVKLMFDDLLLKHFITEFELIYTVDETFLTYEQTLSC